MHAPFGLSAARRTRLSLASTLLDHFSFFIIGQAVEHSAPLLRCQLSFSLVDAVLTTGTLEPLFELDGRSVPQHFKF